MLEHFVKVNGHCNAVLISDFKILLLQNSFGKDSVWKSWYPFWMKQLNNSCLYIIGVIRCAHTKSLGYDVLYSFIVQNCSLSAAAILCSHGRSLLRKAMTQSIMIWKHLDTCPVQCLFICFLGNNLLVSLSLAFGTLVDWYLN